MICQRCQRSFRSSDGVRCRYCDSRYHVKCIADINKNVVKSGYRVHPWRCALCQAVKEAGTIEDNSKETLINIVNALNEKFELVNKIQLPKLKGELEHIKYMSDHIAKQNEDILRKMDEIEKNNSQDRRSPDPSHSYRKRNLNVHSKSHRHNKSFENNDHTPMIPSERMRYRTRRRSYTYLLNRMLHLINRKLNRTKKSPRKRHR